MVKKSEIWFYEFYIRWPAKKSRIPVAWEILRNLVPPAGHRLISLFRSSPSVLSPFIPSTPFRRRRRCGNVPCKWFVIIAVTGIRADKANIPSSVRAFLNSREIDFATPSLGWIPDCTKVANRQEDHTYIHDIRISPFIAFSENAIRFLLDKYFA